MLQSQLFTKVLREFPKDEESLNAKLLIRGGFIYKNSAGIYSFLPLGWRVIQKIAGIIREEINAIGGQELFMPALIEKRYLDATGRWNVEIGFEARGKKEERAQFSLGWTHEEILTEIASKYVSSYKDLPFAAYQIQTKFRNEPRAKSGLLRGREFIMKDLYSFHASQEDFEKYYKKAADAYRRIFKRCGLDAVYTVAAGGAFTVSNTHEFQVVSDVGEDTILVCEKCRYSENAEISKLKNGGACPECKGKIVRQSSIEVGNIFPLGTKYSEGFNLQFLGKNGKKEYAIMGSYGIGLGRVMAAAVETHNDDNGIVWPDKIAPFSVHLLEIGGENKEIKTRAKKIYDNLQKEKIEVLYDERTDSSAGEKFAEADIIGIPYRAVVSERAGDKVEVKRRNQRGAKLMDQKELIKLCSDIF